MLLPRPVSKVFGLVCVVWVIASSSLAQAAGAVAAYRYAAGLYDIGEYELAAVEFDAFLASFPDDSLAASAAYWRGESLFRLERYGEAADAFSAAIRPQTESGLLEDARLRRAEALSAAGDPAGASLAYEALLNAHPRGKYRGEASYRLGRAYVSLGRKADAVRVLKNAAAWSEDSEERADAACIAGDLLRDLSRCEEAGEQYRDVLRLTPHGRAAPAALEGMARCALEAHRWEEAADALRQLTESFPSAPQAKDGRFNLAESLAALHKPTEALAAYKAVLRDNAAQELWDEAFYGEAWAYAEAGDTVAALASFAQLAADFPTSQLAAEAKFREAQLAYGIGEYSRARRGFSELLGDWPAAPWASSALYWRGWTEQKEGGLADAERDFLNYAATFPDSQYAARALLLAGLTALDQKALSRAAESLERCRATYPDAEVAPQVLSSLVTVYARLGRAGDAERVRSELALDFAHSEEGRMALVQKAYDEFESGKDSAALASLGAVLTRSDISVEEKARATYRLADVHYRLGDFADAESLYAEAEVLNAGDDLEDDAVYGRAWAAQKRGDDTMAGQQFHRLATSFPTSPYAAEATLRYGQTLYEQGNYREAAAEYLSIVDRQGGSEYVDDALYAAAWAFVKAGDTARASTQLQKLVELHPASDFVPDALYDLGSCYMTLGRPAATARTLHRLLKAHPQYPKAKQAAAALAQAYDALGQVAQRDSMLVGLETQLGAGDMASQVMLSLALQKLESAPDEARELMAAIVQRFPDSPDAAEARIQLARFLLQEGRAPEAYDMVARLCDSDNADIAVRACVRAAESAYDTNDFERSATFYQRALATGSTKIDRAAAWYGLAWASVEVGRTSQAIDAFMHLFNEHRQSALWADGSYRLGQLLAEEGRKGEAADVYAALGEDVSAGSVGLDAMYRRALLLRERKAYTQAATLLRKVAAGSDSALALQGLFELGRTLHEQGRLTDATGVFVELAGKAADARMAQQAMYSAGVCQAAMKRWAKAAEHFAAAAGMPGQNRPDALLGEGWARAELGEHREAARLFGVLLRESPDYTKGAEVSFRLARSLQELRRYAQVDSICTELVARADWSYPDRALYLGATAKEEMGDTSGAAAAYGELIADYPSSDLVPYAKGHLDKLVGEE